MPPVGESVLELDEAFNQIGSGWYQWLMLLICGLANASDAVEILSIGLVLPAAEEELHLTADSKGALASVVLLGMLMGGLVWGLLGDRIGRKWSLLAAVGLNAFFGALSTSCQHWQTLVSVRFFAGIGVGGTVPIVFSHLAELLPQQDRGKFMVLLAAHWMVGSLYSASVGWMVIPKAGWRVFLGLASLPAWLCAVLVLVALPESPRFLLLSRRPQDAIKVLKWAAHLNGSKLDPEIALAVPSGRTPFTAYRSSTQRLLPFWRRILAAGCQATAPLLTLFSPPLRSCTICLLVAWMGLGGGWYAVVLWIPEYFKARCSRGEGCGHTSIYADAFFVALANLPGNIASVHLVDAWGRKVTTAGCLAGACVAVLLFAAAPAEGAWPLLAACVFNGISTGGWNALDLLSAELYPTAVRSSGMGLLGAAGRVASAVATFLAGRLSERHIWAPLLVSAALLAAGSSAMMGLPEPAGKPLQDVLSLPGAAGAGADVESVDDNRQPASTATPEDQESARLLPMEMRGNMPSSQPHGGLH